MSNNKAENGNMNDLKELAEKVGHTHDGGNDDRVFHDDLINVFAGDMTEEQYVEMEQDMRDFCIKRKNYKVVAWNDCGGYDYWNKQSTEHDSNYIQVTAYIKNVSKVDPEQLKRDIEDAYDHFCVWDNVDYHDFTRLTGS